tara:strand:+ start:31 stop:249 length:219 start_codon:yes stop_codon:yes gene_type:complete
LSKKQAGNSSLLLAEVREYLAKGSSLYRSLVRQGVPHEIARHVVPLANEGHENSPTTEIAAITEALLGEDGD